MKEMIKLKEALYNKFKPWGVTRAQIDISVWEGDPYGWSKNAAYTISTEQGLPSSAYEALNDWIELNNDLAPLGLFAECVNCGVVAVYRD